MTPCPITPCPVTPRVVLARSAGLVALSSSLPLLLTGWVRRTTNRQVVRQQTDVLPHDAALVLGAGVLADGRPSLMLVQRVQAGCDLLAAGQVRRLLLSGDGQGSRGHDEVEVMHRLARSFGAAESCLLDDRQGLNTLASCRRAVAEFGITEAVVVTQCFHAPRAAYLARRCGLTAQAFALPDRSVYGLRLMLPLMVREVLAVTKAVLLR